MKNSEIIQGRLFNQGLSVRRFDTAEAVTEWLGAIQGQDYPGAKYSIGMRTGLGDVAVEKAINERKIIRTWPLRGTLHFVSAKDIRWILSVGRPLMVKAFRSMYRQRGLDEKAFTQCFKIMEKLLRDGASFTRPELAAELSKKKISTEDYRLSFIIGRAAIEGIICFGAKRGKQYTFTSLDHWSPGSNPYTADDALAELSKRYFQSRGPASIQDFMWWSGLPKPEALRGLSMIKSSLLKEEFKGKTYYFSDQTDLKKKFSRTILLPGFDEYLLGYTDRGAVMDFSFHDLLKQGNAMFLATVVINGRVSGFWRRTLKKDSVIIETTPLDTFSEKQKSSINAAAKNFGKFLKLTPQVA